MLGVDGLDRGLDFGPLPNPTDATGEPTQSGTLLVNNCQVAFYTKFL